MSTKCSHCGDEVVTEVGQEYGVEGEDGKVRRKTFYSKESRIVEITHKRDFHHPDGYVWETWTAVLCEVCGPQVIAFIGTGTYWID